MTTTTTRTDGAERDRSTSHADSSRLQMYTNAMRIAMDNPLRLPTHLITYDQLIAALPHHVHRINSFAHMLRAYLDVQTSEQESLMYWMIYDNIRNHYNDDSDDDDISDDSSNNCASDTSSSRHDDNADS